MTEIKGQGLRSGYDQRNFDSGPKTYTDQDFVKKIFTASGIGNQTGLLIADIMSGPGKLGKSIERTAPDNKFVYLDLSQEQLGRIAPNNNDDRIRADARKIPFATGSLDVTLARYSIKDLTPEDQLKALNEINRILKNGGTLVIADMVATDDTKEWLNAQHSLKQEFNGRDITKEGTCHIPTLKEWEEILVQAGFKIDSIDSHMSFVNTSDWLNGNQISPEQLNELNRIILTAPDNVRKAFNIRQEDSKVLIDYPVTIIGAKKI